MGRFLSFLATFVILFGITVTFLAMVDALPEPRGIENLPQTGEPPVVVTQVEAPARIVIKDLDIEATVQNPDSTDIAALDRALLKGVVRYPTSALLGEDGTVLLFGHSSHLPVVHNRNYKAFNDIQKLKPGAVVSVYSASTEYRYAVVGVRSADAEEDVVELSKNGRFLALVTCDNFATKSDRFVVTATFIGAYPAGV